MAFGKYRYSNIIGEKGTNWNIEIWKDGFTGGGDNPTEFKMQGEGFEITWNGQGSDRSPTFLGSECNINFFIENNADEAFVYDSLASGFQSYYVRIYKGTVTNDNIWWFGWVQPSFDTIENLPYPYVYKLVATDSIGYINQLKPFTFASETEKNNSNTFVNEFLFSFENGSYSGINIGGSTSNNLNPSPDNHKWLRTSANWWRDGDESSYNSVNPLSLYHISKGAFSNPTQFDEEGNVVPGGNPLDFKLGDVLKGISRLFGLKGYLAEGKYNFIQPNELLDNSTGTLRTYNYSAVLQSQIVENIDTAIIINTTDNPILGGSTFTYDPPLESVSLKHSQGASNFSLSFETNIEGSGLIAGFLAANTGVHTMHFVFHNNIRVTKSDFSFNSNHDVFSNTYRNSCDLTIKLSNGTNNYYLQSNGTNQLVWTLNNSTALTLGLKRGYAVSQSDAINDPSIMPSIIDVSNNADWDSYDAWPCKRTPYLFGNQSQPIAADTYLFRTNLRFTAEIQEAPISGTVTIGTSTSNDYFQRTIGQASIVDPINDPTPISNKTECQEFSFIPSEENNGQSVDSEITYRATQSDVKAYDTKDLGSIAIGQRMAGEDAFSQSSNRLYSIQKDLGGNVIAPVTEGFRKGNSGGYQTILQLVVEEYLLTQVRPLQILQADVQSADISPLKVLKYKLNPTDSDFKYYQFLGGTFKAQSEIMSGEWCQIDNISPNISTEGPGSAVFSLNQDTNFEESTQGSISSIITQNKNYISLDDYGVIDTAITAGSATDKFQIDGTTTGRVYDNQKLRLSYPDGSNSVIITSRSELAKGATQILIDSFTSDIDFPIGSMVSALKSDLTNVKAENVLDVRTAHYHHGAANSEYFVPLSGASLSEENNLTTGSYHLMFTAPYNGFIKSISNYNTNTLSKTSDIKLYKNGDSSTQIGTTLSISTYTTKFNVDCPSNWVFTKGDTISIGRIDTAHAQGVSMSIVLQYNTQPPAQPQP